MRDFIEKFWVETIMTSVIAIFSKVLYGYSKKIKHLKCSYNAMECVMLEVSKAKMLDIYHEYKDVKKIPLYWLEVYEGLYNAYKQLGGNGIMTRKHEEVLSWDIEED